MTPLIHFKNFSFRYDSQAENTLEEITLDLYPNEKILILGASGSGKSTFGHCLNGLIPNAFSGEFSGEATLNGKPLMEQSIGQLSYQVGTVLQDSTAQFVGMSVAEDVAFALENDEVPDQEMHQRVNKWLNRMTLDTLQYNAPQALSGGQKQRVSMAGVLIDQPQVLLFDEPLASLDPASGYETMALINDMQQRLKTTVLIIEHRLEEVLSQPIDRVLVFDCGRIVYDGTPDCLLKTSLLTDVGIREPLYLSAARYAGVAIEEITHTDSLAKFDAPNLASALNSWYSHLHFDSKEEQNQPLLTLNNITFQYPYASRQTLESVSFTIHRGEMISVVGTNGAGKSTLAKIITGFLSPLEGQILWEKRDITQTRIGQRAEKIGYVMQDPNQMFSQHLIFDEIALGLRLRGYDEDVIQNRVYEILKVCGLYAFREWPISALSYGQKKRVSIAAILVLEPDLLILDEPTAGQDYRHYTEFMTFIQRLNQEGLTIVMITHDIQLMLEYTNRTLVMTEGRLLADRTPFEVLTSETLTAKSALRPTSLYHLAKRVGITNPTAFVQNFIYYERQVNANE